jgi:hypothetical protein
MAKDGTTGVIMVAGIGAVGYYLYSSGMLAQWFPSLFGASAAAAPAAAAPAASTVTAPTVPQVITPPAQPAGPIPPATTPPASTAPALYSGSDPKVISTIVALTPQYKINGGNANGTSTFSGFQWDFMAKIALGSGYVALSSLAPSIVGQNQYALAQYAAAVAAASASGMGRAAIYLPRRNQVMVMPRSYHWKGSRAWVRGASARSITSTVGGRAVVVCLNRVSRSGRGYAAIVTRRDLLKRGRAEMSYPMEGLPWGQFRWPSIRVEIKGKEWDVSPIRKFDQRLFCDAFGRSACVIDRSANVIDSGKTIAVPLIPERVEIGFGDKQGFAPPGEEGRYLWQWQ